MTTLPGPERLKELREWLKSFMPLKGGVLEEVLAILDALPALQAENERLNKTNEDWANRTIYPNPMRPGYEAWKERAEKAEADLAAARPLIEAVDSIDDTTHLKAFLFDFSGWVEVANNEERKEIGAIIDAALAYRNRQKREKG